MADRNGLLRALQLVSNVLVFNSLLLRLPLDVLRPIVMRQVFRLPSVARAS